MKQCNKCKEYKPLNQFNKNGKYLYSICSACKRLAKICREYKVSVQEAKRLESIESCEICGYIFDNKKIRHIHHISTGVRGVICQWCNHILGQETSEDLHRIQSCLSFVKLNRKNLFDRDNPQGRLQDCNPLNEHTPGSPHRQCKICKGWKPLSEFPKNSNRWYEHTCKNCRGIRVASRIYNLSFEQIIQLRQINKCQCCRTKFTKDNWQVIHHINNIVYGIICNNCNRLLGSESEQNLFRLKQCEKWILRR